MEQYMPLIMIGLLLAMIYLFMFRPQMKRQKQMREMQEGVGPGDRVMLISGVYATVIDRRGDDLTLEIAEGVRIEAAQVAIARPVEPAEPQNADDQTADDETADDQTADDETADDQTTEAETAAEPDGAEPRSAETEK